MDIKDLAWNETLNKRFNNSLFPISLRGLIVGKSGSGKTTLLFNLLLRPGWLHYDNLYVFGKSLFQPEYRILKKPFRQSERNHEPESFSDQSFGRNGDKSYQQIKYREQVLRVGQRRTRSQRFKFREEKSHDFRRPPVRKTKQMRGLLHQRSSQQRGLFLPCSKLLHATTSKIREKTNYLSLSARPQEHQPHLQRPRK